jgi:rare lipoprotein A
MLKTSGLIIISLFIFSEITFAQKGENDLKEPFTKTEVSQKKKNTKYGMASFYADKFNGRKTANGEIYSYEKYTAACNQLPINTWIKVTYLKNKKSVIVRINDRLSSQSKCLVDLSKFAAQKLGIIAWGIVKVKVEVLKKYSLNK